MALPLGLPFVHWSYDLLQLCLPHPGYSDPVVIHMDEQAMQDYRQKPGQPWPRSVHARLLNRLSQDRPKVVVFDVTMTQSGDPAADDELAGAIRRNGRVVLAGDRVPVLGMPLGYTLVPPLAQFETNAAAWGTSKVHLDSDRVGRRYDAGDDQEPSLDWAAATVAGAAVTRNPERRLEEIRWLNYYGSSRPFEVTSMTYTNAETRELGFFTDKAVFIGGKPETLLRGEIADVFGTPFTKWDSRFTLGVEIAAIAYANLVHEDWLRRMTVPAETGIFLLTGSLLGLGFQRIRLRTALWLSLLVMILLATTAVVLLLTSRLWFAWLIVALAQLPCALAFRSLTNPASVDQAPVETTSSGKRALSEAAVVAAVQPARLKIPDHTLIRCIGEGAYGQVWIARNAVGLYHAVKVVYRDRFGTEVPYERAFRGIEHFMPISRSRQGFVHILHVGRNDDIEAFFYIMEAGDDQKTGQQIDPLTYAPRTLASDLRQRGAIPPLECLEFMLALVAAVEGLHQHQLIHRDIKPANIIFVNDHPKLADIDLVTSLSSEGAASRIGTEGYLAPEGPGTAAADVFSLGRILYVALTAKLPDQMPELSTRLVSQPDYGLVLELHGIACKACDVEVSRRYVSAAAMHLALLEISRL